MTPAARLSAAIEVMADIEQRRRPASDALKDWGLAHRFAGSGDRAAIAGIAYDALRRKASAAFLMGEDTPRAVLLGMLRLERGMDVGAIARLADGARFAPAPLSEAEQKSLRDGSLAQAPAHIAGDYPEWLDPHLARVFGEERAAEGASLYESLNPGEPRRLLSGCLKNPVAGCLDDFRRGPTNETKRRRLARVRVAIVVVVEDTCVICAATKSGGRFTPRSCATVVTAGIARALLASN